MAEDCYERQRDDLHRKKTPLLALPHLAPMVINAYSSSWLDVTYVSHQTKEQIKHQGVTFSIFKTLNVVNLARQADLRSHTEEDGEG